MSRVRTFIAVDQGKEIRQRLVALQQNFQRLGADLKWVEAQNIHVTLLFLGEIDDRELPALCKAVAEVAAQQSAFTMSVEGVGCFPNARRPRVVWAGVGEGKQELVRLHDALEGPLLELGCYRREEREYTPHLTLGRVAGDRPGDALGKAITKYAAWKGGETAVGEVHVMSSELKPDGPIYAVMSRARLGGE
jgi:2'-5' RNA ligase